MHPDPQAQSWSEIYRSAQFGALVAKRKKIAWLLLTLSLLSYFSIPFFTAFFPGLMATKIGDISFALLWGVLQYPIVGLIAICYAAAMRHIDQLAKQF